MTANLADIVRDLDALYQRTTRGEWGKGRTSHETVSLFGTGAPYHIAEFRHADDAAFLDACHMFMPEILRVMKNALVEADRPVPEFIIEALKPQNGNGNEHDEAKPGDLRTGT